MSLPPSCAALELRSLPSTGITRPPWYCGPLRHPAVPTWPSRAVGWRVPRHRQGFPCCVHPPPSTRAAATTPAEPVGACVARFPTVGSLPRIPGGSASASLRFEACAAFTSLRPAWSLNRPGRPFVIGVLQPMSLPPSSAPTATGWSDSCRAGFAPAVEWRLSQRTEILR